MVDFKSFIEKKNNKADSLRPVKEKRIEEYISLVDKLYSDIDNDWLRGYVPDQIKTGVEKMILHEDSLGEYEISKKWIQIGDDKIYLIPAGTLIIGSTARVDLVFGAKSVMIMWIEESIKSPFDELNARKKALKKKEKAKYAWKMAVRNGSIHYEDVTPDSFKEAIVRLIDE